MVRTGNRPVGAVVIVEKREGKMNSKRKITAREFYKSAARRHIRMVNMLQSNPDRMNSEFPYVSSEDELEIEHHKRMAVKFTRLAKKAVRS